MTERVAFIGLGRMGSRIARNIGRAGYPLVLFNRTAARAEELAVELGAEIADTPVQAVAGTDVVVTMLSDDAAVEAVYAGGDGALGALRAGKLAC
jgi:3-hydroxyisobutyrate dehydrogenase-like beta-hydroxyacid dehydrogenase